METPEPGKGKLVIISAPSGGGKTTLVHRLMQEDFNLAFSISACSRQPRSNEVDGRDYYFLSSQEFMERVDAGDFVEWEEVYPEHYYGTLHSEVMRLLSLGHHVIFDVDVKGGVNIKRQFGEQALAVFIRPPSVSEIERRLRLRSTDSEDSIRMRIERTLYEMQFEEEFDTIVINDDLNRATTELIEKVRAFLQPNSALS